MAVTAGSTQLTDGERHLEPGAALPRPGRGPTCTRPFAVVSDKELFDNLVLVMSMGLP
jgi:hypothetical protein